MQPGNSARKLPSRSAFSHRHSGRVLEQRNRVKPKELLPARRSPPVKSNSVVDTVNEVTSSPVKKREMISKKLAEMDAKLKAEQSRRLELEKLLRGGANLSPHEKTSPTKRGGGPRNRKAKQKTKIKARLSSPGTTLRRGSQVGSVSPGSRRYRHARDMEIDMTRVERELAATQMQLTNTTSLLHETQKNLQKRTSDLDRARGKISTLVGMVKQLMLHLMEKNEAHRFSSTQSIDIQNLLDEPLQQAIETDDDSTLSNYIEAKLHAIEDILPKWASVYENSNASVFQGGSGDNVPPPLPAGVKSRRKPGVRLNTSDRATGNASLVPLAPPAAPAPPATPPYPDTPSDLLTDLWCQIDSDNDGVVTLAELLDTLEELPFMDDNLVSMIASSVRGSRHTITHADGAVALDENQFVKTLSDSPQIISGLQDARLRRQASQHAQLSPRSAKAASLSSWKRSGSKPSDGIPRSIHDHSKRQ